MSEQLHQGQQILATGESMENATSCMIMVHGRGASAEDILGLSTHLQAERMASIAPQAANATWYPQSFLRPIDENEPYLTSALHAISDIISLVESHGINRSRIFLLGFSQGACLSLEYAARTGGRFAGVAGLSGGLIGPPGTSWDTGQKLDETPVFLGCSDIDHHIPVERVHETEAALQQLGAVVTKQIYPGMGHTINEDEIASVQQMIDSLKS